MASAISAAVFACSCVDAPAGEGRDARVSDAGELGEGEAEGEGEGEGEGIPTPPDCAARVVSVNGAVFTPDGTMLITRFDDVRLTSADSQAHAPATSIVSREWSIEEKPGASQAFLTSTVDEEVGFAFEGTAGIDAFGTYCARVTVTDDLGLTNTSGCRACFTAEVVGELIVQLTWSTIDGDLDLHVTKQAQSGEYCFDSTENISATGLVSSSCDNGLDCNHFGCDGSATTPDWDGDLAVSDGDPRLDIDDISGFGPEHVRVAVMPPGQYVVAIAGVEVVSPTTATVRTFLFGQIAAEHVFEMTSGRFAEVLLLRWPEDAVEPPCIEDLTDGIADDQLEQCDAT